MGMIDYVLFMIGIQFKLKDMRDEIPTEGPDSNVKKFLGISHP